MTLNPKRTFKKISSAQFVHRWLMLIFAIPLVIWGFTGSYFVLMDMGFIRSDHIVVEQTDKVSASSVSYPIMQVYQDFPEAKKVTLKSLLQQTVYQINLPGESVLISAQSGMQLDAISEQQAKTIAHTLQHQGAISPSASIATANLLTSKAPSELASRYLPVWQLVFDDMAKSTLYISAQTGSVVTKRHEYWRWFDLFWKWHIMDYDDGETIDNALLFYSAIGSFIAVFSGVILLWQRRKRYS
ncbi:PepSY domain-containing protein [Shewanella olleyana]|uniref:PepSY domain-containing protein n=1 Tax=Shewanella olleyana TaxID=135626 RepID=UPI00200F92F8|nr:PepSY domain-containing protein [Shewanella olleyana]MCL1068420.1 PepSY domain-containing protein [Shewanella olleyana]